MIATISNKGAWGMLVLGIIICTIFVAGALYEWNGRDDD